MENNKFIKNANLNETGVNSKATIGFTSKVLLFLGLGIVLSTIVSICAPLAYQAFGWITLIQDGSSVGLVGFTTPFIIFVASISIITFILMLVNQFYLFARGKTEILMYIPYCILMGLVVSFTSMFVSYYTFGLALGVSALAIILMGAIGYFSKGRLNTLAIVGIALTFGSVILSLLNFFIFGNVYVMWIITFATLIAVVLFVAFDFRLVKEYSLSGNPTTGVAIYCAFRLYNDFIYIFIRLLTLFSYFTRDSSN
ncbi:MAG: Bax inhibitor-1 family protein [Bacilli bacterium]